MSRRAGAVAVLVALAALLLPTAAGAASALRTELNEIESDKSGVVKEILVENGQAVEYGQPLFVVG